MYLANLYVSLLDLIADGIEVSLDVLGSLVNLDSFAKAIAPVLSQKIFIGPDALGMTPISDMNSFIRCFRSSYVLRFTCRSRYDALLGTAPTDSSTI